MWSAPRPADSVCCALAAASSDPAASAPSARAKTARSASASAPTTAAPACLRSWTKRQPIDPSPTTTAVSPGCTRARRTARRQQASGSTNDAASSLTCAGTRKVAWRTLGAGTRTYSANPPGSRLDALNAAHIDSLPRRQWWQSPHGTWWAATTRHGLCRDNPIARRIRRHAAADRRHLADDLVAEDRRDASRRVDDLRDVRAAEPAALETQQELAVAGRRPGPLFGGEPPAA